MTGLEVSRVGMRMPEFTPADPELRFNIVDRSFQAAGITSEAMKFGYALTALGPHYTAEVRDIIMNPPAERPYESLKTELVKRLSLSQEHKTRRLLEHEEIGDRKPEDTFFSGHGRESLRIPAKNGSRATSEIDLRALGGQRFDNKYIRYTDNDIEFRLATRIHVAFRNSGHVETDNRSRFLGALRTLSGFKKRTTCRPSDEFDIPRAVFALQCAMHKGDNGRNDVSRVTSAVPGNYATGRTAECGTACDTTSHRDDAGTAGGE
ncbi:hypothetical protein ALC57_15140 [Trachymyrmex cornetzi]|uniref:DUF7041 domain-containing protein n=1 Tax=Trachymyrmex cornetzi TaxID=471704 RepID=A0A151IXF4_9HYME|nr:hypothetical protein ALC57_15140 [Trachymyrmex cornetzi]